MMTQRPSTGMTASASLAFALCVATAVFEGADMVSMGLAAPWTKGEFAFGPGQMGGILSINLVGMVIGALTGGRLADLFGRKNMLMASMFSLGVFSLATIAAWDFGSFLVIRLLVGLGLGGAFPILIAIGAELATSERPATSIGVIYCGNPAGSAVLSLIVGLFGAKLGWRGIFFLGAIGPLIMVPLLGIFLHEPARFAAATRAVGAAAARKTGIVHVLFGGGRIPATLLLWGASFLTLAVIYLLLSWIPSLMMGKGLTREQGALAAVTLHLGSVLGIIVSGIVSDRGFRRVGILVAYAGLIASLGGLVWFSGRWFMFLFSATTGFCMLASQLILYSVAAQLYPTLSRGTGVGGAISIGRLGATSGPLIGGALLSGGMGASSVLAAAIPGVAAAALCAFALLLRLAAADASSQPV